MELKLKGEFVELDNVLKVFELVANGAEAKHYIQSGKVKVNGSVETRVRRKLRVNDNVEFSTYQIRIIA